MPKNKKQNKKLNKIQDKDADGDSWRNHNIYDPGVSASRIVTRSQTCFNRLKNSASDLELFSDSSRHHPPHLPHLMVTLKGPYGAIPNTIITRSTGQHLGITKELCEKVNEYKKYKPDKNSAEAQPEKSSILSKIADMRKHG